MKRLRSERGMTLVSILAAFTMLALILAVFSAGLSVSSGIWQRASDGQNAYEKLYEQYCGKDGNAAAETEEITVDFFDEDGKRLSLTVTQEVLTDENGNTLRFFR